MAVAALFNIPGNDTERTEWAFAHMAHHRDIIRVIKQLGGPTLPEYILDPLDPRPGKGNDWQRWHQTMHQQVDAILGLQGYNLLGLDWSSPQRLAGWIQLNGVAHRAYGDRLGLG